MVPPGSPQSLNPGSPPYFGPASPTYPACSPYGMPYGLNGMPRLPAQAPVAGPPMVINLTAVAF